MKAVVYHYVQEYQESHPYFRFLDFRNFMKQLDYFDAKYGFVEKKEWQKFLQVGEFPDVQGKVILTFDDSLKCHYHYVFPELIRRNLWAIFYIPSQPYTHEMLLDVHKIHLLCGALEGESLFSFLMGQISEDMIPDAKKEEFRSNSYIKQDNYSGVSEFKRLLNYYIDYQYRGDLLTTISERFGYFFETAEFYVNENQLKEMHQNGMVIGSHTASHPVMSKLSRVEQQKEISESFEFLNKLEILGAKTYCHPYGGSSSFDVNTIQILEAEKVDFSFSVEHREITKTDFRNSMNFLPRFDCNNFKFGKAS